MRNDCVLVSDKYFLNIVTVTSDLGRSDSGGHTGHHADLVTMNVTNLFVTPTLHITLTNPSHSPVKQMCSSFLTPPHVNTSPVSTEVL